MTCITECNTHYRQPLAVLASLCADTGVGLVSLAHCIPQQSPFTDGETEAFGVRNFNDIASE